ncbi:MAG: nitroreductase family protein [Planctomycetota bacterium]|nr:MAG: nitroreductase family protein [Planctomycetota bacterium]
MDTLQAIMTRRSVRRFQPRPVAEEKLKRILEAGMNAPSAMDGRPWQFVVFNQPECLQALAEGLDQGLPMIAEAPAAILICGDLNREPEGAFWPVDCTCAAQNMLLAAHGLGLGAVWIAVYTVGFREEACRRLANLPERIEPFALILLGDPAEELPAEYRYEATRVHFNRW